MKPSEIIVADTQRLELNPEEVLFPLTELADKVMMISINF